MKKIIATALALIAVCGLSMALADGTTTLTMTVPAATYTLVIPASQTVPFSSDAYSIGAPYISESSGFTGTKHVQLTVSYEKTDSTGEGLFECPTVSTTIAYMLRAEATNMSRMPAHNGPFTFSNMGDGTVSEHCAWTSALGTIRMDNLTLLMDADDLEAAEPGTYSANVIFTTEVKKA